jgi:dTDP-glucose pyrophosphorylase
MINNQPQSWRSALLPLGSTIQQAIRSLEISSMQIILIVSEDGVLVGTLTDGDIRRAFLKGLTLGSRIDDIIHCNPLVVPPEMGREHVLRLMQANKIHQLPVVNCNGRVEGLYLWDAIIAPTSIDNFMVIMAGGRGTRLHPHTENCPKPMVEVGGKPMLEHIIEHAKSEGFQNFIISLYYLGDMIVEYFGDGTKWGVKIEYLREDSPLGTAGCLSLISDLPRAPFIVTNGDVLTEIGYRDILNYHIKNEASATMAVRRHEIQNQFGVVKVNGIEIEGFEEKPVYCSQINAGIYAIDPGVLSFLEVGQKCDMPTLFERVKNQNHKTIVFPMHESWLDVGYPKDLAQANRNDSLRRERT